jgi:hypothetical protein
VVRNGRAVLVPITIDRDFGSTVEMVAGLQLQRGCYYCSITAGFTCGNPLAIYITPESIERELRFVLPIVTAGPAEKEMVKLLSAES